MKIRKKKRNRLSGSQKRKRNAIRGEEWRKELDAIQARREKAERKAAWEQGWAAGKAFAVGEAELDGYDLGARMAIRIKKYDEAQIKRSLAELLEQKRQLNQKIDVLESQE